MAAEKQLFLIRVIGVLSLILIKNDVVSGTTTVTSASGFVTVGSTTSASALVANTLTTSVLQASITPAVVTTPTNTGNNSQTTVTTAISTCPTFCEILTVSRTDNNTLYTCHVTNEIAPVTTYTWYSNDGSVVGSGQNLTGNANQEYVCTTNTSIRNGLCIDVRCYNYYDTSSPPNGDKVGLAILGIIAAIVAGAVIFIVILVVGVTLCCLRKSGSQGVSSAPGKISKSSRGLFSAAPPEDDVSADGNVDPKSPKTTINDEAASNVPDICMWVVAPSIGVVPPSMGVGAPRYLPFNYYGIYCMGPVQNWGSKFPSYQWLKYAETKRPSPISQSF